VTLKGKVINFKYGNFDMEKFKFENLILNSNLISNWIWPPMGWGGGMTADDDRGCYDPV